jgi:hypothetical protein
LRHFQTFDHALHYLSSSLGEDNVELAWFIHRPTPDNLHLARRNYASWEPPPSNDEWVLEENLLRELSERYRSELMLSRPLAGENAVVVAARVAQAAASRATGDA